jgi:hypothetical protein
MAGCFDSHVRRPLQAGKMLHAATMSDKFVGHPAGWKSENANILSPSASSCRPGLPVTPFFKGDSDQQTNSTPAKITSPMISPALTPPFTPTITPMITFAFRLDGRITKAANR